MVWHLGEGLEVSFGGDSHNMATGRRGGWAGASWQGKRGKEGRMHNRISPAVELSQNPTTPQLGRRQRQGQGRRRS